MHRANPYGSFPQHLAETAPPIAYRGPAIPPPKLDDPDSLQSRTLFFGRLPSDVTTEYLRKLCEKFGEIKKCIAYPDKHMGFVEYYDLRNADSCRVALKGHEINGKKIEVQFSTPRKPDKDTNTGTLYVRPQGADRGFVDPNSPEAYQELFSQYGDVKKVSCNRKREAEKFIEFHDFRHASKAQESLNGYEFNGISLEVQFAQNPSRNLNKDTRGDTRGRRAFQSDGYGPLRTKQHANWANYAQSPYSVYSPFTYRNYAGYFGNQAYCNYYDLGSSGALGNAAIPDPRISSSIHANSTVPYIPSSDNIYSIQNTSVTPSPDSLTTITNPIVSAHVPQYAYGNTSEQQTRNFIMVREEPDCR